MQKNSILIITQVVDVSHPVLGFFHTWLETFSKEYESVSVIALQVGEYSLPENVHVYSLGKEEGCGRITYVFRLFKYIWQLRNKYTHVFVHMNVEYLVIAGWFFTFLKKPCYLWYTHKHVGMRLRIASWFVEKIFTASEESMRLRTKKKSVVGHGIPVADFPFRVKEKTSMLEIITVGRISPIKNVEKIIEVLSMARERGCAVALTIVGSGDPQYIKVLSQKVHEKGLQEHVEFAGNLPYKAVAQRLHAADIFINMSGTGSLDKAVLEAMAVGVLPVSSNEGLRSTLPNELVGMDVEGVVEILCALNEYTAEEWRGAQHKVREIVDNKHSLDKLVPRLVQIMQNS